MFRCSLDIQYHVLVSYHLFTPFYFKCNRGNSNKLWQSLTTWSLLAKLNSLSRTCKNLRVLYMWSAVVNTVYVSLAVIILGLRVCLVKTEKRCYLLSSFLCDINLRETPQYNMSFVQIPEILIHYIFVYQTNTKFVCLWLQNNVFLTNDGLWNWSLRTASVPSAILYS